MPELDVLRGLAILGVFLLHSFSHSYIPVPQDAFTRLMIKVSVVGWVGVPLFFVLSGFLITGILLDTRLSPNYYRRFYYRRVLRILPAYLLIVSILLVTRLISIPYALISLGFLSNYSALFGNPPGYSVFWSLAVEEHFYLLWPTVVRHVTGFRLALVASVLIITAPFLRLYHLTHGPDGAVYYYTWCNMDGLALGALTCLLLRTFSEKPGRILKIASGILAALLLVAAVGRPWGILTRATPVGAALQMSLVFACFAAVILFGSVLACSPWQRFTHNRVLEFFGYISYGLYLYHPLFLDGFDRIARQLAHPLQGSSHYVVLRFCIAGGLAVLFSYASRRFFEDSFLALKDRWAAAALTKPAIEHAG